MTQMKTAPAETFVEPDFLYEVVDGQVVEKEMSTRESALANLLMVAMGHFSLTNNIGWCMMEMLFLLDKQKNLQRRPDISFISFAKWPRDKPFPTTAAWDMVPNLAVEIVSPTNTGPEIVDKIEDYFTAGVERVWVAYPSAKKVYVYRSPTDNDILTISDDLDGEHIIPGFRFPLKDWF